MKILGVVAIAAVVGLAFYSVSNYVSSDVETQFQEFLSMYGANYGSVEEYNFRIRVFSDNLQTIERLRIENPLATFGVNKFADRTQEEMNVRMGLIVPAGKKMLGSINEDITAESSDYTYLYDHIEDQGSCGSCWAFSAAATFEARKALADDSNNPSVDTFYSEQQLVDCEPQSSGCNGGLMDYAFQYLTDHHFCSHAEYPYTAVTGSCKINSCDKGPVDTGYADIPQGSEDFMYHKLHDDGPIAVAVDATSWPYYQGGILTSCSTALNHGVTLVGYNADENAATIRNSWGESWGESGHIRLAAGQNMCGIATMASFPTFE